MALTTSAQQIIEAASMRETGDLPPQYWELIERYRGLLVNQALAIVGNIEDADDVVQETFCEAFRNSAKLAQVRSLGAWLRSINRANALNRLRDKKRRAEGAERKRREAPGRAMTSGGFSLVEIREAVAQAIEKLPPKLRTAVVLRYWEHLSHDEIAARLKIPPGTARWLLCEASNRLHGKLKEFFEPPPEAPRPAAPSSNASNASNAAPPQPGAENSNKENEEDKSSSGPEQGAKR